MDDRYKKISLILSNDRIKKLIFHWVHLCNLMVVQDCWSVLPSKYPRELIFKYEHSDNLKKCISNKYTGLIDYRIKRGDRLPFTAKACPYVCREVKNKETLDFLYNKYKEYFYSNEMLEDAAYKGNEYLFYKLESQTHPRKLNEISLFTLQFAMEYGASDEFIWYLVKNYPQLGVPFNIFEGVAVDDQFPVKEKLRMLRLYFEAPESELVNRFNYIENLKFILYCDPPLLAKFFSRRDLKYIVDMVGVRDLLDTLATTPYDQYLEFKEINDPIQTICKLISVHRSIKQSSSEIYQQLIQNIYGKRGIQDHEKYKSVQSIISHFTKEYDVDYLLKVLELVRFLDRHILLEHENIKTIIKQLIKSKDVELVIPYLMEYEVDVYVKDMFVFDYICKHGTIQQVKHAHSIIGANVGGRASHQAMDNAVQRSDGLEIVEFLYENRKEQCSQNVFRQYKSLESIQFIVSKKPILFNYINRQDAMESSDLSISKYVDGLMTKNKINYKDYTVYNEEKPLVRKKMKNIAKVQVIFTCYIVQKLIRTKSTEFVKEYLNYYKHDILKYEPSLYYWWSESCRLGELEIIKHLHNNISPNKSLPKPQPAFQTTLFDDAYLNGMDHVVEYLVDNFGISKNKKSTHGFYGQSWRVVGQRGTIKEFEMIRANSMIDDGAYTLQEAVRYSNMDLIKYIVSDKKYPSIYRTITINTFVRPIRIGKLETLQLFLEHMNLGIATLHELFYLGLKEANIEAAKMIYPRIQQTLSKLKEKERKKYKELLSNQRINALIHGGNWLVLEYLYQQGMITKDLVEKSDEFDALHHNMALETAEFLRSKGFNITCKVKSIWDEISKEDSIKIGMKLSKKVEIKEQDPVKKTEVIKQVFSNVFLISKILGFTRLEPLTINSSILEPKVFELMLGDDHYRSQTLHKIRIKDIAITEEWIQTNNILEVVIDQEIIDSLLENYKELFVSAVNYPLIKKLITAGNIYFLKKLMELVQKYKLESKIKVEPFEDERTFRNTSKSIHYLYYHGYQKFCESVLTYPILKKIYKLNSNIVERLFPSLHSSQAIKKVDSMYQQFKVRGEIAKDKIYHTITGFHSTPEAFDSYIDHLKRTMNNPTYDDPMEEVELEMGEPDFYGLDMICPHTISHSVGNYLIREFELCTPKMFEQLQRYACTKENMDVLYNTYTLFPNNLSPSTFDCACESGESYPLRFLSHLTVLDPSSYSHFGDSAEFVTEPEVVKFLYYRMGVQLNTIVLDMALRVQQQDIIDFFTSKYYGVAPSEDLYDMDNIEFLKKGYYLEAPLGAPLEDLEKFVSLEMFMFQVTVLDIDVESLVLGNMDDYDPEIMAECLEYLVSIRKHQSLNNKIYLGLPFGKKCNEIILKHYSTGNRSFSYWASVNRVSCYKIDKEYVDFIFTWKVYRNILYDIYSTVISSIIEKGDVDLLKYFMGRVNTEMKNQNLALGKESNTKVNKPLEDIKIEMRHVPLNPKPFEHPQMIQYLFDEWRLDECITRGASFGYLYCGKMAFDFYMDPTTRLSPEETQRGEKLVLDSMKSYIGEGKFWMLKYMWNRIPEKLKSTQELLQTETINWTPYFLHSIIELMKPSKGELNSILDKVMKQGNKDLVIAMDRYLHHEIMESSYKDIVTQSNESNLKRKSIDDGDDGSQSIKNMKSK